MQLRIDSLNLKLEKNNLKLEIKKQTVLFLIECHNQQMTISEAVVMINNLEDGQQFLSEPNED